MRISPNELGTPPKRQATSSSSKAWGTECAGSSEAVMLAMLAHKRVWQEKRRAAGKPCDKPNIVMGNDVHLVWNKGVNYFEIEQRLIPLHPNRFTISAAEVIERVDENTICVVGVLGTSYTFQYDPIEDINSALVQLKREQGLDVPLHVDGASGAFIAPFLNPELKWDFRLEQVKTINISGHKYGLVYPGLGGALWRDAADIPQSLVAVNNVANCIRLHEADLRMDSPGELQPSMIRPQDDNAKESHHRRDHEDAVFRLHHLFVT